MALTSGFRNKMPTKHKNGHMKAAKTKELELQSTKMEEKLNELKRLMNIEREERITGGFNGFWTAGQNSGSLFGNGNISKDKGLAAKKGKNNLEIDKKMKIKLLKDTPIILPGRNKEFDKISEIMKRDSQPEPKGKGPKCGQCDSKIAKVQCEECAEIFCGACFASFHLKGAMKRHRSIPLHQRFNDRIPFSPVVTPRKSDVLVVNEINTNKRIITAKTNDVNILDQNTSKESTLLQGDYDEDRNASAFQDALIQWRESNSKAQNSNSCSMFDDSTNTVIPNPSNIDILMKPSLTYAEKLLLKKFHRNELTTNEHELEISTLNLSMQETNDENDVYIQTTMNSARIIYEESPRAESISLDHSSSMNEKDEILKEEFTCQVVEVIYNKTDNSCKKQVSSDHKKPEGRPILKPKPPQEKPKNPISSRRKITSAAISREKSSPSPQNFTTEIEEVDLKISLHRDNSSGDIFSTLQTKRDKEFDITPRNNQYRDLKNNKKKICDEKTFFDKRSKTPSRPSSRTQSRSSNRNTPNEHELAKGPGAKLIELANRSNDYKQQMSEIRSDLSSVFLAGYKEGDYTHFHKEVEEKKEKNIWKLSNKVYHLSTRSWRPESALAMNQEHERSTTNNISYFNSPLSSRSDVELPYCNVEKRISIKSLDSERPMSRAIELDGDDLSRFDQMDEIANEDEEDMQSWKQLDWELASNDGRLDDDGRSISRLGMSWINDPDDVSLVPRNFNVSKCLRESSLMHDFEDMEKLVMYGDLENLK